MEPRQALSLFAMRNATCHTEI